MLPHSKNPSDLKLGVATLCRIAKLQKKGAKLCLEKQNAAFVTFLALVCSNYSTNKGATL